MSINHTRLRGVDLCRGLAAYAVILVHSGDETWGLPIFDSAIRFRLMFYFAVPFFLAAAFFFLVRKPTVDVSSKFWRSRVKRILIPYTAWSLLYIALRASFYLMQGETDRFAEYFADPIALIFLGGASYQLYFLPLLMAGTLLLPIAKYLVEQKTKTGTLAILAALGIFINEIVYATGNSFELGKDVAFAQFLVLIPEGIGYEIARFILVQWFWMLRCFPYVVIGIILSRTLSRRNFSQADSNRLTALSLGLFILVATVGKFVLSHSLQEVLSAYLLLLAGIFGSGFLGAHRFAKSIGIHSFGIYLIHPVLMNFAKGFTAKIFPQLTEQVSISSMLTISISTFVFSWLTVAVLSRSKLMARLLFGS